MTFSRKALIGLAVIGAVAGAPAAPVRAQDSILPLMSDAQEARFGAEQHEKIMAEFGGAYDKPELASYVDSIGQFLAQTSERSNIRYTFTVLNSPIVNAFALPGGYVYVTRGLLALADNEAELAGVVAHEIGHVAARHGSQRQSQGLFANLGLTVLGAITRNPGLANLAQLGAAAVLRGYSRDQELEADTLGVGYMARAGFNPQAMASFLTKLKAHGDLEAELAGRPAGDQGLNLLATHPRTGDRVQRAIETANVRVVADPIVARDIYLKKIDGIIFGDDPAQGMVKGRLFVHPRVGFQFQVPKGFDLINGQQQVIAKGPEGAGIIFDGAARTDRRAMTDYIAKVWLPKVELFGIEPIHVGGFEAATAVGRAEGGDGKMDVRVVAIAFDAKSIYRFTFVGPPQASAGLDLEFRRTAYSFRALGAAEAKNYRPMRLTVYPVRAGDTIDSLAARTPFDSKRVERLRVLNGLAPGARLGGGETIKLVLE